MPSRASAPGLSRAELLGRILPRSARQVDEPFRARHLPWLEPETDGAGGQTVLLLVNEGLRPAIEANLAIAALTCQRVPQKSARVAILRVFVMPPASDRSMKISCTASSASAASRRILCATPR